VSDRAATILGVCIILGCGAVAWSNWAIAEAHQKHAVESRQQAIESRKQAKELAEEERRFRTLPAQPAQKGHYQLLMNSEGKPLYLLNTETGEVRKADLTFSRWEAAVGPVK
jgi:hypothetical protein